MRSGEGGESVVGTISLFFHFHMHLISTHTRSLICILQKEIFGKSLKNMDPFDGLDDEDIRTAIANATGPRPSLFVSEFSFDLLVSVRLCFPSHVVFSLHCISSHYPFLSCILHSIFLV